MSTVGPASAVQRARGCDWQAEYAALSVVDRTSGLPPEDLEQLAVAAFVTGRDDELIVLRHRAYEAYLADGMRERALRCGFWIGFHLQNRGEHAQAAGWLARLRRLVHEEPDERFTAWLTMPDAVRLMWSGDASAALPVFEQAGQVASGVSRHWLTA